MNNQNLSLSQHVAVGTILTVIVSAMYVIAYSVTAGFPVFIYVSSQDFLVLSFSWALPVVLAWAVIIIWKMNTTKYDVVSSSNEIMHCEGKELEAIDGTVNKTYKWLNPFPLSFLFSLAILYTVLTFQNEASLWSTSPIWALLLMFAIWERVNYNRMQGSLEQVFGRLYEVYTFYTPLIVLFSTAVGFSDGNNARRYIWGSQTSVVSFVSDENELIGRVAFNFRDFLLVRTSPDWDTIALNKSVIRSIRRYHLQQGNNEAKDYDAISSTSNQTESG